MEVAGLEAFAGLETGFVGVAGAGEGGREARFACTGGGASPASAAAVTDMESVAPGAGTGAGAGGGAAEGAAVSEGAGGEATE